MSQCWCETPSDRPTFVDIRKLLESLQAEEGNYLDLDNIDVPINQSESDTVTFQVSSLEGEIGDISARYSERGGAESNVSNTVSPRSSGISLSCENLASRKPPFLSHECSEDQGFIEDCSKEESSLLPNEMKQVGEIPPTVAARNLPPATPALSNQSKEILKERNSDLNLSEWSATDGSASVLIPMDEKSDTSTAFEPFNSASIGSSRV